MENVLSEVRVGRKPQIIELIRPHVSLDLINQIIQDALAREAIESADNLTQEQISALARPIFLQFARPTGPTFWLHSDDDNGRFDLYYEPQGVVIDLLWLWIEGLAEFDAVIPSGTLEEATLAVFDYATRYARECLRLFILRFSQGITSAIGELMIESNYQKVCDMNDSVLNQAISNVGDAASNWDSKASRDQIVREAMQAKKDRMGIRRGPKSGVINPTKRQKEQEEEKRRLWLAFESLQASGFRPEQINKTLVATFLYSKNENALQALRRPLQRCGLTFDLVKEEYFRTGEQLIVKQTPVH